MIRPTYLPSCDCHEDGTRNFLNQMITPNEAIELLENGIRPSTLNPISRSLFRTKNSWSLTPIGER